MTKSRKVSDKEIREARAALGVTFGEGWGAVLTTWDEDMAASERKGRVKSLQARLRKQKYSGKRFTPKPITALKGRVIRARDRRAKIAARNA